MLVFIIGMLLCVIIAIVVILLIASPSFREGERILTPQGEEKVQNVKRRAASVAARAEQDASRSAEAVKAAVRNRRRTDAPDDESDPEADGAENTRAIPIDDDVVEDRAVVVSKGTVRDAEESASDRGSSDIDDAADRRTEIDLTEVPEDDAAATSSNQPAGRSLSSAGGQDAELPDPDLESQVHPTRRITLPTTDQSHVAAEPGAQRLRVVKETDGSGEDAAEVSTVKASEVQEVASARDQEVAANRTTVHDTREVAPRPLGGATPLRVVRSGESESARPLAAATTTVAARPAEPRVSTTKPAESATPVTTNADSTASDSKGAEPVQAVPGEAESVVSESVVSESATPQAHTPDRLWVQEDDDLDDDIPEHFESPTTRQSRASAQPVVAEDEEELVQAPAAAVAEADLVEEEPVVSRPRAGKDLVMDDEDDDEQDGGFFTRITSSLNRSSTDRSRTGPRHARS